MKNPLGMLRQGEELLHAFSALLDRADSTIIDVDRAVRESLEMLAQVARTLADVDLRSAELYVLTEDVRAMVKEGTESMTVLNDRHAQLDSLSAMEARLERIEAALVRLAPPAG